MIDKLLAASVGAFIMWVALAIINIFKGGGKNAKSNIDWVNLSNGIKRKFIELVRKKY